MMSVIRLTGAAPCNLDDSIGDTARTVEDQAVKFDVVLVGG